MAEFVHPMLVAVELAQVIANEQDWLKLAHRNYPPEVFKRLLTYAAQKIGWALADHGLGTLPVRVFAVRYNDGLHINVGIGWGSAPNSLLINTLAVRDASRRLFQPVARA